MEDAECGKSVVLKMLSVEKMRSVENRYILIERVLYNIVTHACK